MPKITSIEAQQRHPDRFSLFLEGAFWMGVHAETVAVLRLKTGQEYAESELERIVHVEEVRQAREYALKLLSYRPRSEAEVRRRLLTKGFASETAEAVLEALRGQRLIDDADFASRWIEHRRQSRPMGRVGLTWELRQKGIDRNLADATLESFPDEAEREAAHEAARRALSRASGDLNAKKKKIAGLLRRRGFPWEVVQEVLESLLPEENPETVEDFD